jgi:hypothetical protein
VKPPTGPLARSARSMILRLILSATTPIIGAENVPENRRAPSTPTRNGELVSTMMYQPSIRVSISDPQLVIASADHWNLKLRIPKAANGATLVPGNREDVGVAAEAGIPLLAWDAREIGCVEQDSDVFPLEFSDPSATIAL